MPKATEIAAELQAKASPYIAEAEAEARELRGRLQGLRQSLSGIRRDPPPIAYVLIGAVLIVGTLYITYRVGRTVERSWWRSEIAAKSAAAKTVMTQLGHDAPELDARLTAALGDDRERLARAERMLREVQARPQPRPQADAPADPCRPLPAQCLR